MLDKLFPLLTTVARRLARAFIAGCGLVALATLAYATDARLLLDGAGWTLAPAPAVEANGNEVSTVGFDDRGWLRAVVPGTVLTSYVAAGKQPEPWFGDRADHIPSEFFAHTDFWYRDRIVLPAAGFGGRRIWLEFDGINWKADVFLNGAKVGQVAGAFTRARFDVTRWARVGGENILAVLIHEVAHPGPGPGKVVHKKLGSPTTNGDVLGYDSPTFVAGAGWNWLPIIPDRNIGIWNHVAVVATGDVTLDDPWVSTVRLAEDAARADLQLQAEVRNHGTMAVSGRLLGSLEGASFEVPVSVPAGQTVHVALDSARCPALAVAQPRLWWPNGYGAQPLYRLQLRFEAGGQVSDSRDLNFGIRTLGYTVEQNILRLQVNGRPVQLRGGNWGMDEGMLRCDAAGYDLRVRLHHDAGLNMIRNWVGMVGRDEFYDACDRYGILVWDDFWLANPNNGPEPTDHAMFLANARDKVKRVRRHPSLALYCGRNEGYPPEDLDAGMKAAVTELDNTRLYIPHSAAGLVTGFGPYIVQDVEWYFAHTGRTLHSELGIVAVPPVESMRAMMPAQDLWPINDMWAVHDYQSPRAPLYTERIARRYGAPTGIEDYCAKAQLVNLETAKAMYEALRANLGSGTLVWMTQPAWPSVICQLYDYWFEPTGAYFGARSACEPLHVFWNADTDQVTVANDTLGPATDVQVIAEVFDLAGRTLTHREQDLSVDTNSARSCFALPRPSTGVFFVRLVAQRAGTVVSRNFYWGAPRGESCAMLRELPRAQVHTSLECRQEGPDRMIRVVLMNESDSVALALRLQVLDRQTGRRVLPVFYSDNYVSLAPHEQRVVELTVRGAEWPQAGVNVAVSGWNAPRTQVSVP